jgi:hypothetical protein
MIDIIIASAVLIFIQIMFLPSVVPLILFLLYSFWVPQIWRNASRGHGHALDTTFVIGTTVARLALPVCELTTSLADPRYVCLFEQRVLCGNERLCLVHRRLAVDPSGNASLAGPVGRSILLAQKGTICACHRV